jgi:hypothetical protein
MTRLLFLSVVVLLVFASLGMSYGAGLYWDYRAIPNEAVTDKDYDIDFTINDDRKPATPEIEGEESSTPTVPRVGTRTTPATRRSIETPRRLPKPRSVRSTPRVTEAAPRSSRRNLIKRQSILGPAAPPKKKKLPSWGKVDTKPSESKSKFKWGER